MPELLRRPSVEDPKVAYDDRAAQYIQVHGNEFVSSQLTDGEWELVLRAAGRRSFPLGNPIRTPRSF